MKLNIEDLLGRALLIEVQAS